MDFPTALKEVANMLSVAVGAMDNLIRVRQPAKGEQVAALLEEVEMLAARLRGIGEELMEVSLRE